MQSPRHRPWSRRSIRLGVTLLACACLSAPPALAEEPDPLFDVLDEDEPIGFPDPLESFNRATFRLNDRLDRFVLDPITMAYRAVVPDLAKRAVVNALVNLNSPVVIANDAMQGRFHDAGITLWRFVINSTVGVAGLMDPASRVGVEGHFTDFGQTLACYRVPSGPYLVLPLFGPTTARDSVGAVVDLVMRPTTFFMSGTDALAFTSIHRGSYGIAWRADSLSALQALEEASLDYYAALRNAYYQNRTGEIRAHCGPAAARP